MSSDENKKPPVTAPEFVHLQEEAVLSGYLYKKTRDGRWQRRWFETNGVYLTYYKSRKMEKLLAALSLPQVGDIRLIPPSEDPEKKEGLFALELNTRVYTLRAKSESEAQLWVNTLRQIRQQGIAATASSDSPSSTKNSATDGSGPVKEEDKNAQWMKESRGCGCC
mmetsp:Transcript_12418/g.18804  ORF Transcript_12418/g.18804 Transcript_12418/m.18804 type:complete len:166 (+) Transcript_12418:107-604(+)|eukprot:CAMPEP_0185018880 /NCGR_PEP_ID=MMETSP1103-20130426/1564_1 /TAXON_ID=36769 /ORGANISM="Paraphysomonas bandaiensis, Strain Caron Lab Isolate" /LENGTH=165 /DNA_ID=CAMNT_0027548919 /DNA_START=75 /DNA_END=572 /DNA_ORIENTATION=-